jgi:hypothetical protein
VYPEDYTNRVEELIRKSRPGDPYNRNADGEFAHQESRGWTYREATDDHESHHTVPRRARQVKFAALKDRPVQRTMVDTDQETKTDTEHESAFGGDTESAFGSGEHESAFGGGSAFAPAARRVRASQALKEGTVTTILYKVDMATGDSTPVDPPPPNAPPPSADDYGDPIGPVVISHQSMLDGKFQKVGSGTPTVYPRPGDVIDFGRGADIIWDEDIQISIARHKEETRVAQWKDAVDRARLEIAAEKLFDYDVDVDNLSPAEEEALDEYLSLERDIGADDHSYTISNDMVIYDIEDARGLPVDPETMHKRVLGKYYVVSVDYIEDPKNYGFSTDDVILKAVLEPWTGQTE